MPSIRIDNGQLEVYPGGGQLDIQLSQYDERYQGQVIQAIQFAGGVSELDADHIRDEKIMDAIIELAERVALTSIRIGYSYFRPAQLRILSCSPKFIFSRNTLSPGGQFPVCDREHLEILDFVDCQASFVQSVTETLCPSVRTIRSVKIWSSRVDPQFISRIDIKVLMLRRIDILELLKGNPTVQQLDIHFDWMSDRETAIRFADTMYRLHARGMKYLSNTYIPGGDSELVLDRLKLFAARTIGKMDPADFTVCWFGPDQERIMAEQRRIAALPYGAMMILLVAKRRLCNPIRMFSTDIFTRVSEMLGTTDIF